MSLPLQEPCGAGVVVSEYERLSLFTSNRPSLRFSDRSKLQLYGIYDRVGRLRLPFSRGHPMDGPQDPDAPPIFIIGSGRSGNTLLRAMLMHGGEVAIPPESYVLPRMFRDHTRFGWMPWSDYTNVLLGRALQHPGMAEWDLDRDALVARATAIPEEERSLSSLVGVLYAEWAAHHAPGVGRWGDKTPLNTLWLPRIERMFPDARYVHILRDGRDVALSYVKAGLYGDLEDAAGRWRQSVRAARRHGARVGPGRFHEVRYEDLVAEPVATLGPLCSFLGLSYKDTMLDFWKSARGLGDSRLAHHDNLKNPLSTDSIGRFRGLDKAEQQKVHAVIGPDLEAFGYRGMP